MMQEPAAALRSETMDTLSLEDNKVPRKPSAAAEKLSESALTLLVSTDALPKAVEEKPQVSAQAIMAAAVSCLLALAFGWSGGKVASTSDYVSDQLGMSPTVWYLTVSIQAIGTIIGGLLGGPIGLKIGPYWTQYVTSGAYMTSGVIMSCAHADWLMIIGRIVNGIALGLTGACVPPYLYEIAPRHLAGVFGCLFQLTITFGFFVCYLFSMDFLLGTPALWRVLWAMPGIIGAVHAVAFFFCPGPVMFLLQKGDQKNAHKALKRLRRGDCTKEFEMLCEEAANSEKVSVVGAARELLTNPWLRFPLVMAIVIPVFVQFSGVGAVMSYATGLFQKTGMDNPKLGVTIVGLVHFLFTLPSLDLVDRLGRRALFGGGLASMAVFYVLFTLGLVFDWGIATIIFMFGAIAGFSVGPGPVAWMWISEIVPTNVRPAASAVLSFMIGVSVFIVLLVSEPMFNTLGNYALVPYACLCTVFAACTFTCFPETKGKSYAQVEEILRAHPIGRLLAGKAATRISPSSA